MTGKREEPTEVAVRARTVRGLFNSLDPSPFVERDLDPHADEFVTGWVSGLPRGTPFTIVVELPSEEAALPEAARVAEAFANHYALRVAEAERELKDLLRVGRWSVLIGLIVLALCLTGSHYLAELSEESVLVSILSESLIIVGWVANWRPIEIYLYDWWPILRRIRLFRRIAAAPVEVRGA